MPGWLRSRDLPGAADVGRVPAPASSVTTDEACSSPVRLSCDGLVQATALPRHSYESKRLRLRILAVAGRLVCTTGRSLLKIRNVVVVPPDCHRSNSTKLSTAHPGLQNSARRQRTPGTPASIAGRETQRLIPTQHPQDP
jgi:hypothetical protein